MNFVTITLFSTFPHLQGNGYEYFTLHDRLKSFTVDIFLHTYRKSFDYHIIFISVFRLF